jgi:hypothetical protein
VKREKHETGIPQLGPFAFCLFAGCRLPIADSRLPSAVCLFAVCRLTSHVRRLPFHLSRLPSAVCRFIRQLADRFTSHVSRLPFLLMAANFSRFYKGIEPEWCLYIYIRTLHYGH